MTFSDLRTALPGLALLAVGTVHANSCESLRTLKLDNVSIDRAESIVAGAHEFPVATGMPGRTVNFDLPAFCRVAATLRPTAASEIHIEVWLPSSGWNRKFLAVGNGGWSGAIFFSAMAPGLKRGYAVAGTDTGHTGSSMDGSFALGQPEKLVDFGWRAVHTMTVTSKAIIEAYYEQPLTRSYWQGCSSGGKQGLKEAQRFPQDFDGIIAGAPAVPWTRLTAASLVAGLTSLPQGSPGYLTRDTLKRVNDAIVHACDRIDGVQDGVLEDPRSCDFDVSTLVCDDSTRCLTAEQAHTVQKIHEPLRHPVSKQYLFAGFAKGSEIGWGMLTGGPKPLGIALDHYRYVVFSDPDWDYRTFDLSRDLARAEQIDAAGAQLNAADPDLDAFRKRGGKLLMYHGWSDALIPAQNTIDYFEAVLAREQKASRNASLKSLHEHVRLFMVPGMDHCSGGPGANQFDALSVLENWVEQGIAPETIEARGVTSEGKPKTRKLCLYPQVARYDGRGDPDFASSFRCE